MVCYPVGINLRINLKVYIVDNTEENGYVPGNFFEKGDKNPWQIEIPTTLPGELYDD